MVALLFFVMCATVGSIILTAATASSGRLKNLKEDDQGYFAASSAMNCVSDLIRDAKISVTYEAESSNGSVPSADEYSVVKKPEDDVLLSKMINRILEGAATPHEASGSISISSYEQVAVNLIFSMDSDYNLTVTITPEAGNDKDVEAGNDKEVIKSNVLKLTFPSMKSEQIQIIKHENVNKTERTATYKKVMTISWGECVVAKGSAN